MQRGSPGTRYTERPPMLGSVLLIILIFMLLGALPVYPYSRKWGYAPGGVLGTILIIVLILVLLDRI